MHVFSDRNSNRFSSIAFFIISMFMLILIVSSDRIRINEKTPFKPITGSMIFYEYSKTNNDNEPYYNVHIYLENNRSTMYVTPATITNAFMKQDFENDVHTGDTITIWIPVKEQKRKNNFIYALEANGKKYLDINRTIELVKNDNIMGIFIVIGLFVFSGFLFFKGKRN